MKTRQSYGFTMVELIVVVIVISILAAIIYVAYNGIQEESRDSKRANDMVVLSNQLEKYFDKNGIYPTGCGSASCTNGTNWSFYAPDNINTTTTLSNVSTLLNLPLTSLDPKVTTTTPFIGSGSSVSNASPGYFYRGGHTLTTGYSGTASATIIQLTEQGGSRTCTLTASFNSTDTANSRDTAAFVLGYYSEVDKVWKLSMGDRGIRPTVGGANPTFCVVTN